MTLYPSQDSFVRGEVSPRLHARASLDLYRSGLAVCRNFITLPHGGIRKRSGTYLVNATKDTIDDVRLIEFVFSAEQAYCLEIGNQYLRIHAYGAYLGIEVATPWTSAEVADIQYVQSADVMWLVHPNYYPRKLTRLDATTWTVSVMDLVDGPFATANLDETIVASVGAVSGDTTITTTFGIFNASDVGRLFRIEMESYTNIQPWEPGGVLAEMSEEIGGKRVRYDGNVYVCVSTGATAAANGWRFGSTPPTHLRGTEPDGPNKYDATLEANVGVQWEYLHSGFGVAKITAFTSSTAVDVEILSRFPEEVVADGGYVWSFGAFAPGRHATAVALYEERLVLSNKLSVYASKTGDFSSFQIGEKDDDAMEFLLAANQANDIVWLADADGMLAIGTIGGVRGLSGSGVDEALTPSSFKNRANPTPRCANLRPIKTGQAFLYVTSSRRAIAEMVQANAGRFDAVEASQISEHILKEGNGVRDLAYQEVPDPIAWMVTNSGELVGFTYQRDQDVRGFHRHSTDGTFESVCVTPGQNGADDVWVVVRRTVNGVVKRFVEILQPAFEYQQAGDAFCVDCGLTYEGAATTTVTGLSHLNGSTVSALADGTPYEGLPVSGDSVTLPVAASKIHVGLPYVAEAETLELDVGAKDGSLLGRKKRVTEVILSLLETDFSGLEVSSPTRRRWETVKTETLAGAVLGLQTDNVRAPMDDSWQGKGRIRIRHSGPTPCTIRAAVPAFDFEP